MEVACKVTLNFFLIVQGGGPVPTPPQGARYNHSTGPSSGGFGTRP